MAHAEVDPVDHGSVIGGYFGLLLLSSAYIGIGIFASSISKNQIIAFLAGLIISFAFHFVFGLFSRIMQGNQGAVLNFLSTQTHFDSIYRGVIDSRDIIFFVSLTFLALFLSRIILSRRNWKD